MPARFLNIPIFIVLVCIARAFDVTFLSAPPVGNDQVIGAAFEVTFETGFAWLMLAVSLPVCGAVAGFGWPSLRGGAGVLAGLLIWALLLLASWPSLMIVLEFNDATRSGIDYLSWARAVVFGLPVAIALYAAWIANTPSHPVSARAPHLAALCIAGAFCLVAVMVSMREASRAAAA